MAFSTDSADTSAILDKVGAGNQAALEHLLTLHRPFLKRVIEMRMEPALRTRIDASDVAQETQVMIAKGIEQFIEDRPTSFRIWMRRKALDQLKDQRRRHIGTMKRSVLMEQNISDVSSIEIARKLLSNSPSSILGQIELRERVYGLIEQMQLIRGRSLSEVISSLRHVRDEGKEFDGSSISQITNMGAVDDRAEADLNAAAESALADSHREAGAETVGTVAKANSSTIPHSSRREYYRSVAALGIQAATALQYAHDLGIIHRDIKPANLLLDGSAKLYVTDFGLARIESDAGVTMTGDVIGTLRYMSPEQALAKRVVVDHRADIYSLAATLYELLTLRPVYVAEDRQQLLKQIAFEEPALLRRIDRDIPAELETIVHKAMAKDMDQRYSSAQELADDLRSHLDNRPILAKPPTISETIGKWTRRNPILTWSAIITLSLVTITLVASTLLIANQRDIAWQMAETRRQGLYAAQVNLAHQAWIDGDLKRARNLLALQRPAPNQTDLRGFEWRYLWQLCQDQSRQTLATRATFTGGTLPWWHSSTQLDFSADGGKLAIAEGKTVRVWDFPARRELPTVAPHAKLVSALVFSPVNPGLLATAATDGKIRLWDLDTNLPPSVIAKDTRVVVDLAFSPDGNKLAAAKYDDGEVELWDVATRTQDWSIPGHGEAPHPAFCVTFSPDGKLVASAGGGPMGVRLLNAATGDQVGPPIEGHTSWAYSIDFSPDGRLLATCGMDARVLLWDVTTRRARPALLGHKGPIKSLDFSPDGETLLSGGGDHTIRSWSVATSRQTNILRGHTCGIRSIVFSPDGQSLVSASLESVKLWDATPHGSKDVLSEHAGWVESVVLSPDGKTLASVDYRLLAVKLWDVSSRSFVADLLGHTGVPRDLAISADGKFLASGGDDQTVRLWDLSNHETIAIYQCGFKIGQLGFSSAGTVLGATGGGLKFWNVASGREIELIKGDTNTAEFVAFSPRGKLLATADTDGKVVVWDADNGKEVTSFRDEIEPISSLLFSSDGHLIAIGKNDGSITLFDVAKQEILQRFQGHPDGVFQVAFTPDSETLASAGYDGKVNLWNVATGQLALTVQHLGPATDVTFSNDGRLMVTSGADATARLWHAASLSEADASLRSGATDRIR